MSQESSPNSQGGGRAHEQRNCRRPPGAAAAEHQGCATRGKCQLLMSESPANKQEHCCASLDHPVWGTRVWVKAMPQDISRLCSSPDDPVPCIWGPSTRRVTFASSFLPTGEPAPCIPPTKKTWRIGDHKNLRVGRRLSPQGKRALPGQKRSPLKSSK